MDDLSVISLSSTSSRASLPDDSTSFVSIVSVSSESERVPVSWESSETNRLPDFQSSNQTQKVQDWIYSCTGTPPQVYDPEDNQMICIRYDFDKSTRAASLPQSCYTQSTPLFSYMEEAKKSARAKSADFERLNGHKINYDTPLSPESQKTELCSYLQLMKPINKEANFLIEHRRSGRVRRQLNEKKKLEEKLKDKDHQAVFSDFGEYERVIEDVLNYPTLKSLEELNMKMDSFERFLNLKKQESANNKLMPLPPDEVSGEVVDFEESIREIIDEAEKAKPKPKPQPPNGCLRRVRNRRKFKFDPKLKYSCSRINSLRSKGHLRNISLDTLILRKSNMRKKVARRRKLLRDLHEKPVEPAPKKPEISPRCEIISVHTNSDDENVDLKNFVDDMLELDKMSEEHRKSVIESRILASSSITNLINKQTTKEVDVQRALKIFSDLSNERKSTEGKENSRNLAIVADLIVSEHDYANLSENRHEDDEVDEEEEESLEETAPSPVPIPDLEPIPVNRAIAIKSLHRSLAPSNKRKLCTNNYGLHNWSKPDNTKVNHPIRISKKNGPVHKAFYQEFNLIIAQQNSVSFWTQSALGNVLGAQNMWIPKGQSQRIPLNSTYIQKDTTEMVITTETSVAYVELWTKEHKSDIRQLPVADVFAVVYFSRLRQNGLDKKVLQLENIKGFPEDVQYVVLRCYQRIIVSWHCVQGNEKKTKIHSYHLAADFQTVANISEIQPVEHYVSSLHNIEDCESLVMGCGENKITLWNVEYGYIVATVELSNIRLPLSTLWVKCDRGFLFIIQECVDQEMRLLAINGMNHSWKKLQNYQPLPGFEGLKGVCIENGVLVAYYSQGILCWNAQTGELIVEEVPNECEYIPSGKHVIMIVNEEIIVRHSLSHLITADDF